MSKIKDYIEDQKVFKDKELEAIEPKYICNNCEDTGVIERIEWVDTDTSYPRYIKCNCQE